MARKSRADLETPPVRLVKPSVSDDFPPAPTHLSEAMRQWWTAVVTDYDLDPHHLLLLQSAAEAWDRMTMARDVLTDEGLMVETADGGKKQHPAVNVERDSRLAFARLLRELDLDAEPPPERPAYRPPSLRSNRRR
jgi:P27 family predicted phage terminase small subunit